MRRPNTEMLYVHPLSRRSKKCLCTWHSGWLLQQTADAVSQAYDIDLLLNSSIHISIRHELALLSTDYLLLQDIELADRALQFEFSRYDIHFELYLIGLICLSLSSNSPINP